MTGIKGRFKAAVNLIEPIDGVKSITKPEEEWIK